LLDPGKSNSVDPHWTGNIFEHLLSKVVEPEIEFVPDLIVDDPRHTDSARFGDPLQSGCYVDPITMNVLTLDDDVAQVDADPEYDPLVFRDRGIALGHPMLHRDRTGDRLDHAREIDQDAVAGRFDNAALVFGNRGVNEFTAMHPEPL
jgi:hypothetical protein